MPRFDFTITLGNVLSIISMVVAMFAAWSDLNTKVAVISTAQAYDLRAKVADDLAATTAYARLEKKVDWIIDLFIKQQEATVLRNK